MAGPKVGHYCVKERIGIGGMGEVFRARDLRLNREVALKFLSPHLRGDPEANRRLLWEARAASALDHPAVCTVFDVGETADGRIYMAMPYYRGITLKQRLSAGSIPFNEAADMVIEIAEAMQVVHEKGIVHLDIKPANLLLTEDGRLKILDFGIARLTRGDDNRDENEPARGTVHFTAPERLRDLPAGPSADIWSLGVLFYLLVTGELPFRGETPQEVSRAVLHKAFAPPSTLNPRLSPAVDRFVADALQRDPRQRLPDMHTLSLELRRLSRLIPPTANPAPAFPRRPAVAIRPLENLGGVEDHIPAGLTDGITHALTHVEGLRVMAQGSVQSQQAGPVAIREMGRILGCTHVLGGSVQAQRDKLRLHVYLVNVTDGAHVWSERLDGHRNALFDFQDRISLAVVQAMKVRLLNRERRLLGKRHTTAAETYDLYLRGLFHINQRTPAAMQRGRDLLKQAVAKDADYAPAAAALADTHMLLASYEIETPSAAYRRARDLVDRALALDDQLATAHSTRAVLEWEQEADAREAERHFERALELAPGLADTHHRYAEFLGARGRFDDALREIRLALELDPFALISHLLHGYIHYLMRDFSGALRLYRALEEMAPDFITLCCEMGMTHLFLNEPDAAVAYLEKTARLGDGHSMYQARLAFALARSGRLQEAEKIRRELESHRDDSGISGFSRCLIHLGFNEIDLAAGSLERAWEERFYHVLYLTVDPLFDDLRSHPALQRLVQTLTASSNQAD